MKSSRRFTKRMSGKVSSNRRKRMLINNKKKIFKRARAYAQFSNS